MCHVPTAGVESMKVISARNKSHLSRKGDISLGLDTLCDRSRNKVQKRCFAASSVIVSIRNVSEGMISVERHRYHNEMAPCLKYGFRLHLPWPHNSSHFA